MHAAALRVFIDVAEHEKRARKNKGNGGNHPGHGQAGDHRVHKHLHIGREIVQIVLHVVEVDRTADDDCNEPERDASPHQPSGDDA